MHRPLSRPAGPLGILWIVCLLGLLLAGSPEAAVPWPLKLHFNAIGSFDPKGQSPRVAADLAVSPSMAPVGRTALGSKRNWIVQFDAAVRPEWRELLLDAGAEVLAYLPDYAYVVRVVDRRLSRLRQIPHVRAVIPFQAAYALSPGLVRSRPGLIPVQIETFLPEDLPTVLTAARRFGARIEAVNGSGNGAISATLTWAGIRRVAQTFGVAWIEERLPMRPTNDVASTLCNVTQTRPRVGLYGTGQIVAVADTGLDTGDAASIGVGAAGTIHPDFRGRILTAYGVGDRGTGVWNDPDNALVQGHGTHVAGSVLGSGLNSGANPAVASYAGSYAGVAPEALLVMQSHLKNNSTLFDGKYLNDFYLLFDEAYALGARIHTNSWGSRALGAYTTSSRAVDRFMWDHPDMLVLFSAGNDGRDNDANGVVEPGTMGAPGTAKNCLTVGATENLRANLTTTWAGFLDLEFFPGRPQDFPTNPIRDDRVANHRSGMAAFSSRGPCTDTKDTSPQGDIFRIKPDLVAPGTAIGSTRSQLLGADKKGWGRLSEAGLASSGTLLDNSYNLNGGTSMSTPLVAGMAALTRQYYQELRNHPSPSAALIKATLLASAVDLYTTTNRGQYAVATALQEQPSKRPNRVQGWGRADLRKALDPSQYVTDVDAGNTAYPSTRLYFTDVRPGLRTGETDTIVLPIANTAPLNVVLAYTDAPPASAASVALVNNLDLDVTAPQGQQHSGNGFASDTRNNVESIDLNPADVSGGTGSITIKITGTNVPQGPQPYAVVVYGAVPETRQELRIAPSVTRCQFGRSVRLGALFNGLPTTGVAWEAVGGIGTITSSGLYTAPATGIQATVRATYGPLTATATVHLDPVTSIVLPPIARVEYHHAWPSDVLNLHVGLGSNPDDPTWTTTNRSGFGNSPALTVEEFDLSGAPAGSLPPTTANRWFVRMQDMFLGEDGELRVFWIRHNGVTYHAATVPAAIPPVAGGDTTTVYIDPGSSSAEPTVLARVRLTHNRMTDLTEIRVGVGPDKAAPIWQSPPLSGTGTSQTGVFSQEKIFGLNGAPVAAFPPSADYPWWVKVVDTAAGTGGSIDEFTLIYNGLEFSTNRGTTIPTSGTIHAWIDPRPPTTSLIVPGGGSDLSNSVLLQATAADNDAIHRVEFFCDDRLITSDTTQPYEVSWNTKAETNGQHRLSVRAYDPTGNSQEAFTLATISNTALRPNVVTTLTGWNFDTATRTLTVTATLRNAGPEGATAWNVTLQRVTLWGTGTGFTGQRALYLQPGSGNGLPRTFPSISSGGTQTLVLKTLVPPEVTSIPRWTSFGYYFDLQVDGNRYYL